MVVLFDHHHLLGSEQQPAVAQLTAHAAWCHAHALAQYRTVREELAFASV